MLLWAVFSPVWAPSPAGILVPLSQRTVGHKAAKNVCFSKCLNALSFTFLLIFEMTFRLPECDGYVLGQSWVIWKDETKRAVDAPSGGRAQTTPGINTQEFVHWVLAEPPTPPVRTATHWGRRNPRGKLCINNNGSASVQQKALPENDFISNRPMSPGGAQVQVRSSPASQTPCPGSCTLWGCQMIRGPICTHATAKLV